MRKLIVYGTKYGSTMKFGELLKEKLGDCDIINIKDKKNIDLNKYDTVIFGTNVIMGMFNSGIKKYINRNKALLKNKNLYGYIVSCGGEQKHIDNLSNMLSNGKVFEVGGVLDPSLAKGFFKRIIRTVIKDYETKGNPLPELKVNRIDEFLEILR